MVVAGILASITFPLRGQLIFTKVCFDIRPDQPGQISFYYNVEINIDVLSFIYEYNI